MDLELLKAERILNEMLDLWRQGKIDDVRSRVWGLEAHELISVYCIAGSSKDYPVDLKFLFVTPIQIWLASGAC